MPVGQRNFAPVAQVPSVEDVAVHAHNVFAPAFVIGNSLSHVFLMAMASAVMPPAASACTTGAVARSTSPNTAHVTAAANSIFVDTTHVAVNGVVAGGTAAPAAQAAVVGSAASLHHPTVNVQVSQRSLLSLGGTLSSVEAQDVNPDVRICGIFSWDL